MSTHKRKNYRKKIRKRKKKTRKKRGGLEEEIQEIEPFPVHLISEQAQNAYNNVEEVQVALNHWWANALTPQQHWGIIMGEGEGGRFNPRTFRVVIDEAIRRLQEQQQGGRRKKKTRKKRGGVKHTITRGPSQGKEIEIGKYYLINTVQDFQWIAVQGQLIDYKPYGDRGDGWISSREEIVIKPINNNDNNITYNTLNVNKIFDIEPKGPVKDEIEKRKNNTNTMTGRKLDFNGGKRRKRKKTRKKKSRRKR